MADEYFTAQKSRNASKDADTLGQVLNGADAATVTSRLGRTYPTVANALRILQESGIGARQYKTYVAMYNDRANIDIDALAIVWGDTDVNIIVPSAGTNNLIWTKTSATTFAPTKYNASLQSRLYVDSNPLFKPVAFTSGDVNNILVEGFYYISNAVLNNITNLPVLRAGSLIVFGTGGLRYQLFKPLNTHEFYFRSGNGQSTSFAYLAWQRFATAADIDAALITAANNAKLYADTVAGTALTSTSEINTLAAGNYYITLANLNAIVDAGTASALGYPPNTPRSTAAKINVVRASGGSYSVQTIEFTNFGTRYTRQGNVGGSFNPWVAPPVPPALQFGSITLADNLNDFVTAGQWGIDAATVAANSSAGNKGYPTNLESAAAQFTVSITGAGNAVQLLTHLNKTRKRVIKVSDKSIVENWTPVGATSIYATEAAGRGGVSNGEVFWVYPNSSNTLEDLTLYKRINATTSAIEFVQVNLNNYLINEGASWE